MKRRPAADASRAVGYVRVSTDAERQESSLVVQRQAIEAWCARHGVELLGVHQDEASGGAPLDKRPGLAAALAQLAHDRAGLLVVHRVDRFSRDATSAALVQMQLDKLGARLAVAEGGLPTADPTADFQRQILLAVAQLERALIRARITNTKALQRARGRFMGGQAPFGYRVAPEGNLEPDEGEQATIAQLEALRSQGLTWRELAEEATRLGLRNRRGGLWDFSQLRRILQRPKP